MWVEVFTQIFIMGAQKMDIEELRKYSLKMSGGGGGGGGGVGGGGVFNLMSGEASGFSADFNSKKFDLPYFQLRKV